MITVRNLKKTIGHDKVPLLKGINLHVEKGEFIAIIGGGGSGKTTLLTCMSGRNRWDEGDIIYKEQSLKTMSMWHKYIYRKQCAYLAQQPELNPNRTAAKNVLSGRFRRTGLMKMATGLVSRDEHYTAHDYLDKVGLLDKANLKAHQLSGGERQRVAIGRALAWGAEVIYADEPISGLDPHSAARVMDDFRRLCREDGLTVVCCLNNIDLAQTYCNRILGLVDGVIQVEAANRRLTEQEKRQILG